VPTFLNTDENIAARTGASAGAVAGGYVFAAGMAIDWNSLQRSRGAETVADEVRMCLAEIEAILGRAGCTLRDVVKTRCFISDEAHRPEFTAAYRAVFEPGPYPARATMVAGLQAECRIQIDAIAVIPAKA
jgi:2-iminobutanoate/2-iminopropanoate deaminase